MANPRRLRAALLASVAATATLVPATAGPAAAADCGPVIDQVTVRDVVLRETSTPSTTTTVVAHDPCSTDGSSAPGIARVSGQAFLSDGSWWDLTYQAGSAGTWTGSTGARFGAKSALGRGQQVVEVTDSEGNTVYRDALPFYVRRNVTVSSLNAAPEPVRKGSYVTVTAVVKRLTVSASGKRSYVAYGKHAVTTYFRPLTSKTYTKVGTSTTSSTGNVSARYRATVDGCWKVLSSQTSQHVAAWSSADCVDVR